MYLTEEQLRNLNFSSIDEIEEYINDIKAILNMKKEFFRLAVKALELEFSVIHTDYYTSEPIEIVFWYHLITENETYHMGCFYDKRKNIITYTRETEIPDSDEHWKEETITKQTFMKYLKLELLDQEGIF